MTETEFNAIIKELEDQRNILASRCVFYAKEISNLKQKILELEKINEGPEGRHTTPSGS